MRRAAFLALGAALLAGAGLLVPMAGPVRLEIGGFEDGFLSGAWSRVVRENLDPPATTDDVTSFYRRAAPPNSGVFLPLVPKGTVRLAIRGITTVRSEVGVFLGGQPAGRILMTRGPWAPQPVTFPAALARGGPLDLSLALRPLPLVRGAHVDRPQLLVDYVEVEADGGLRLTAGWVAVLVTSVWLVFGCAVLIGAPPAAAAGASVVTAIAVVALARLAPLPLVIGLPRLLPVAWLAGLVAAFVLRRARAVQPLERPALAAFVAFGTLVHGALVFFPNHNPPDIDIHVRRSLDLGDVPFEYGAMLRYGSQLPTASQDQGAATAALGERTLIPYSPLPYVFYYGAHVLGLDL